MRLKFNPTYLMRRRVFVALLAFVLTVVPIGYVVGTYLQYQSQIAYPISKNEIEKPKEPLIGAYLKGGYWSRFWFGQASGIRLNTMLSFRSLGSYPTFDLRNYTKYADNGIVPLVSFEPWNPAYGPADIAYSLQRVKSGFYDRQFASWADNMRKFGKPIMLRFAHEMNGPWYPWGATVNGNTPADYIGAWRHVHDLFVKHRATNVVWVWSPNVVNRIGHIPLKSFYPGDKYVDMLGLVGYYKSSSDTFDSIFSSSLSEIARFSSKPLILSETGVSRYIKDPKAKIKDLFSGIMAHPQIVGIYWFQDDKRFPWAMTRPEEFQAFAQGVQKLRDNWNEGR